MRKIAVVLLIAVLGVSCFTALIGQVIAQESTQQMTQLPLIIRWMRFRGAVTQWGNELYNGTVTVNARTANVPPPMFKPWAGVDVFLTNEPKPIASNTKPAGQFTFTHYNARLVWMITIRKQEGLVVNITGIWNVSKIKITSEFATDGTLVKTTREVTPVVTRAKGQLHIPDGWKMFEIEIEGIEAIKGVGIFMTTTTNMMNPFSIGATPNATLQDLFQVVKCFRAMAGFGNFRPELDYNADSKIDGADLTTVAANM